MQYEYKTLAVTNEELADSCERLIAKLNRVGKDEWELVSILSRHELGRTKYNLLGLTQQQFLVLKRPAAQGKVQ